MQNRKLLLINIFTLLAIIFVVILGTHKINYNHRSTKAKIEDKSEVNNTRFLEHIERPDFTYIPKHKNDFAILFHQSIDTEEIEIVEKKQENEDNNDTIDDLQTTLPESSIKTTTSNIVNTSEQSTNQTQNKKSNTDLEKNENTSNNVKKNDDTTKKDSKNSDVENEENKETDTTDYEKENKNDFVNETDDDSSEENESEQSDKENENVNNEKNKIQY